MAKIGTDLYGNRVPCMGCSERTAACHGSCKRYAEYQKIHAQSMKKDREKRRGDALAYGVRSDAVIRWQKYARKTGRL